MFKCELKDLKTNKIVNETKIETQEEVDSWVLTMESRKNRLGVLERLKVKSEASEEEIASAIETIPAVTEIIPATAVINESGVPVIVPERVVVTVPEKIKLPKTYEIIVTDISAEVQAEKDKGDERKQLRQLLKNIKDSDMSTVAELRKVIKDLLKVLL